MSLDFSYLDMLLEEESEELVEETGEGYRHVWVVAEADDKSLTRVTLEVMGQGRDIADQFGLYLFALLLGSDLDDELAQDLIHFGADKVLMVDHPTLAQYQVEIYTEAVEALINERRPEILLLPASPMGNDLAPRLAQRLETGLISHCVQLSLDMAERQLLGTFARMGGEYFHTISCPQARPQIATIEPGCFRPAYREEFRLGEVEQLAPTLDSTAGKLTWLDMDAAVEKQPVSLAQAAVIVSAGRGLKDEQGFVLAQRLADLLGGQTAGSRGALDEGWIDVAQQVGLTGQTVKPDLYIACGISGAIQHYVGMQEAGFVVAINRDEEAPIMKAANVGLVGDVRELITALIKELSAD